MSHYKPTLVPEANRRENVRWTRSWKAKRLRVLAVSCMPDVIDGFPDDQTTWHDPRARELWSKAVDALKALGLLSYGTAAVDVDMPAIVAEAREHIRELSRPSNTLTRRPRTGESHEP